RFAPTTSNRFGNRVRAGGEFGPSTRVALSGTAIVCNSFALAARCQQGACVGRVGRLWSLCVGCGPCAPPLEGRKASPHDRAVSASNRVGMPVLYSLQGHAVRRLGIWIFGRCFRCFRSLSFRNLRFGRWRLGWLLFGRLLLLLFLRRLLNLFHFIFVSHGKSSLQEINGIHINITKHISRSVRCLAQQCNFLG